MRLKCVFPLLAMLLAASCGIDPSVTDVTVQAGQSTTITIAAVHWIAGSVITTGGVSVVSSDFSIFTTEQDPTLVSTSVTIHALRPGTAYINAISTNQPVVTVHVTAAACGPVTLQAEASQIQATTGSPVELRVMPGGSGPIGVTWSEETASGWSAIPSAAGNVYSFLPQAAGTFSFMATYNDLCGQASAVITVHVESCSPVSAKPQITQVEALVGSPVDLRVFTDDPTTVATWYEEKDGARVAIPFATGDIYVFQPQTSGTFHFLVRYSDHCDGVSTLITVVASTRGRAVRR